MKAAQSAGGGACQGAWITRDRMDRPEFLHGDRVEFGTLEQGAAESGQPENTVEVG